MKRLFILSGVLLAGCATSETGTPVAEKPAICANLPEGDLCAYDSARNAQADLAEAQQRAATTGRRTIVVMGADWCHDSRALAGHFEKERFQTLFEQAFEVVYIDVGYKDRNLSIAEAFGLDGIRGTPTIIVTDSAGTVLNLDTAPTWRNAASRTEDAIYDYFKEYSGLD